MINKTECPDCKAMMEYDVVNDDQVKCNGCDKLWDRPYRKLIREDEQK